MSEKFRRPEIEAEKIEFAEIARQRLEELKPLLEAEGKSLRGKGFPVDEKSCRLFIPDFRGFYSQAEIDNDIKQVEVYQQKFLKENQPEAAVMGELLESVKTLALNRGLWFGGRFVSVRASHYDDYFNGVDELIFDSETFEPLAAVDTTTNPLKKWKREEGEKTSKLMRTILSGARVKYGITLSEKGVVKKAYENLPLFVIDTEPENVLLLARDLANGTTGAEGKAIEQKILASLKTQSKQFQGIAGPKLGPLYQKAGEIFEKI